MFSSGAISWNELAPVVPTQPPARVDEGIRITFVNHATVLVQMDGISVLTDPIWSDRASAVSFAGPSRKADPGVRFDDLPKIDAVMVSHSHYVTHQRRRDDFWGDGRQARSRCCSREWQSDGRSKTSSKHAGACWQRAVAG
jgi:hypothetical protein